MSDNLIVSIKEEGKYHDKSKYFSDSQILNHDYQDELTNIFINSHCRLNGGERTNLANNINQVRKIFSEHTDNNINNVWIGVFDIGELDIDKFKEREIKSSKEKHWKNSIHVRFGDVQDKVLVYSWLDINQFNQDKWNNLLSQLEGDYKINLIGTGPLAFKYKDFNYRVYPPLFGSLDDKKSFLDDTEVFNFSPTEVNQIIEDIKESHQSIEKKIIDHYQSLGKNFAENNKGYIEIKAGIDVNNVKNFTDVSYTNRSDDIHNNPIEEAFVKDDVGGNLLHSYVYKNKEALMRYMFNLSQYNDDSINEVNANGKTPLHLAAKYGRKDMVEMLLNKEAKVDIADSRGRTPLHLAAKNNNKEIVEALIKAKANVNIKDEDGKTPLDLATDDKIKTLLQNAEESNPVDESLKDSEGVQKEKEEEDVAPKEPAQPVAPKEPAQPVSTEPAQTEEQPSSFFGSLFGILIKPFSLIGSFFCSFFSWLFGSDEPTQPPPESDQPVVLEPPKNQVSDEPTQSPPESDQPVVLEPPNNQGNHDIV